MNMRKIYRKVAKEYGVSVEEVKREMQAAITDAYTNPLNNNEIKGKGLPHQSGNYDFCGIYPDVGDLKLRAAGLHHGNGRQFRGNLGSLAGAVLCADWSGLLADCGCADCWYLRKGSCGVQLRRSVWCSEYQFRGRNGYAGRHPECFRLWTA